MNSCVFLYFSEVVWIVCQTGSDMEVFKPQAGFSTLNSVSVPFQELVKVHKCLLVEIQDSVYHRSAQNLFQIFIIFKERYTTSLPQKVWTLKQTNKQISSEATISRSTKPVTGTESKHFRIYTWWGTYVGTRTSRIQTGVSNSAVSVVFLINVWGSDTPPNKKKRYM